MASTTLETELEATLLNDEKSIDWEDLRERSLQHGGFGPSRVELWPRIFGVSTENKGDGGTGRVEEDSKSLEHQDEHQIRLDTDRSFVMYPVGSESSGVTREAMQEELHDLLVSVFRKRRKLYYFQGYHDIVTVLFLTLPKEVQFACVEKLSLHRVRDSMGMTLEPVLGLLRVTKNLLRLVDIKYAENLERTSPLPFYALSNLLTLFSHDMPSLSLIQHVFDYILCRPPVIVVYLATALILSRKAEIERLEEEGGEEGIGMVHSVLSGMPRFREEAEEIELHESKMESSKEANEEMKARVEDASSGQSLTDMQAPLLEQITSTKAEESRYDGYYNRSSMDGPSVENITLIGGSMKGDELEVKMDSVSSVQAIPSSKTKDPAYEETVTEELSPDQTLFIKAEEPIKEELDTATLHDSRILDHSPKQASQDDSPLDLLPSSHAPSLLPNSIPSTSPNQERVPEVAITSLLLQADALYAQYPPSHPALGLSSIMGPQSVIYTWDESFSALPGDDEAEAMVACPSLIVYPYIEEDEDEGEDVTKDSNWDDNELDEKRKGRKKKPKRKLKKLYRPSRRFGGLGRQRHTETLVAGAVLVVGVAMAVYGVKIWGTHGGAEAYHYEYRKDWRKVVGWLGGTAAGVAEKFWGVRSRRG